MASGLVEDVLSSRIGSLPVWPAPSGLGGRGLFTSQDVKRGEVLVMEAPIVSVVLERSKRNTCAGCLRTSVQPNIKANEPLTEMPFKCESCVECYYCSQQCMDSHREPAKHSARICSRFRSIAGVAQNQGLDLDQKTLLKWLAIVFSFRDDSLTNTSSKMNWAIICSLDPYNAEININDTEIFQSNRDLAKMVYCLEELGIFTDYRQIFRLINVDARNTYALANVNENGERLPRAHATYTLASFVNHECLPCSCRFDSADSDSQFQECTNGEIVLRALHDLPKGTEITISYHPLGWDVSTRQERCTNDYGFTCRCERCLFEMGRSSQQHSEEIATYCGIFLFKHVCPVEHCGGTMCPKSGWHSGQEVIYECNVCRRERTESQFMAELEEMEDDESDIGSDDPEEEGYLYDDTKELDMDTD